jgi:hypothetical protein
VPDVHVVFTRDIHPKYAGFFLPVKVVGRA